jgi:hypothetical protein
VEAAEYYAMFPMNRNHATREAWQPQTRDDREAVMRELAEILSSPHFANSKRYPALLSYVVENTLAGRTELLKERTLGVEVFHRPATYDTNADTVVRYTAGEVRKRLLLYYSEHESRTGVQISLPAGSYHPEFLREADAQPAAETPEIGQTPASVPEMRAKLQVVGPGSGSGSGPGNSLRQEIVSANGPERRSGSGILVTVAALALLAVAGGLWWFTRPVRAINIVDEFWAPLLRDQHTAVICAGSVVFAQDNYSGVATAGGNTDYPFFSLQTTSAITDINSVVERAGVGTQLLSAPSTSLNDLREHSVTLLGAYNNQWTLRLLEPLRFHFLPDPQARIVEATKQQAGWQRDESQPYSNADDYALVARFRDPRIDGWVLALAGIGRNGTEAAAQFATSPHYLELLRQRMGGSFGNRNIEVVVKVNVIKGETGAPSILAVHSW